MMWLLAGMVMAYNIKKARELKKSYFVGGWWSDAKH